MAANYEIKKLRDSLVLELNKSSLPSEVKRLVLHEIYEEVKIVADSQIAREREKLAKEPADADQKGENIDAEGV